MSGPARAFDLACDIAAITHGHPSGWLPAGTLAAIVALLVEGVPLAEAVDAAASILQERPDHAETSHAIAEAVRLAARGLPSSEELEHLGGGWVGEEALAIAVCCALAAPDPKAALLAAVNHSGDSDSTGAICGNFVGTAHGTGGVPDTWIASLDVGDIVRQIADDLWTEKFEPPTDGFGGAPHEWWARYPGW